MRPYALACMAGAVLVACARPPAQKASVAMSCEGAPTPGLVRVEWLLGTFDVTLVATMGNAAGRQAKGLLTLAATDIPGAVVAGSIADLPLETVGGIPVGELTSRDAAAPGVLGFAPQTPGSEILLRLGSEANRRDVVRFDGAYMVLRAQTSNAQGFAGSWRSGVTTDRAGGYFCAVRVGAPE